VPSVNCPSKTAASTVSKMADMGRQGIGDLAACGAPPAFAHWERQLALGSGFTLILHSYYVRLTLHSYMVLESGLMWGSRECGGGEWLQVVAASCGGVGKVRVGGDPAQ
jgi:hypothetical protein